MASRSSNKTAVPEAKGAMNKFKYEVASELGVPLTDGYNGDLLSLTMVNFSRKKHPGQCRVLFSFSFLVFFLLYMTVFEPLFCLMQTASADDFSSPVTFLPSASPAVHSSF